MDTINTPNSIASKSNNNTDCLPIYGNRGGPQPESPIEHELNSRLVAVIREDADLFRQVSISTRAGALRLDFVVTLGVRSIVIECDGQQYHKDKDKDLFRDTCVLYTNKYSAVYRIRGTDISRFPFDCLFIMMLQDAFIFSERGIEVIRLHASTHAIEQTDCRNSIHIVKYGTRINEFGEEISQRPLLVTRRTRSCKEIKDAMNRIEDRTKPNDTHRRTHTDLCLATSRHTRKTDELAEVQLTDLDIAVAILWSRVSARNLFNLKFRRSRNGDGYFGARCPSAKIAIYFTSGPSDPSSPPRMQIAKGPDGYTHIRANASQVIAYPGRFLKALEAAVKKIISE